MKTVAKGKRSELLMMAVLLESGFNVFQELADEEGIDCGVLGSNKIFYPIQIKSRAEFSEGDLVSVHHFHDNMFIIIFDEKSKDYWIIPADEYRDLSVKTIDGGETYYRLTVKKRKPLLLEKYKNRNGILLLRSKVSA